MTNIVEIVCLFIIWAILEYVVVQLYLNHKRKYEENTPVSIVKARLVVKKRDEYFARQGISCQAIVRYRLGLDKTSDILTEPDKLLKNARYYASFYTEEGEMMKFRVNMLEYEKLIEGEKGNLVYQGKNYVTFHTD